MAAEPDDDNFVSTLDESLKKKAREELNELNDEDIKIAVQTLRKWILEQGWLKSPTDCGFLLRFLRVRKFSQLGARDTIANYWESRTEFPEWFRDVDPADPSIQDILRTGFYLCPKQYDRHGRRTLFFRFGKLNTLFEKKMLRPEQVLRIMFLLADWLIKDESTQVNGACYVADYTDLSFQLAINTFFKLENAKKFFRLIKRRAHGKSLVKIYEDLGMSVIPREYLPDDYDGPSAGSAKDIVEEMIADMLKPDFRYHIMEISSSKYGVDLKKKQESCAPVESFRKLKTE